MDNTVYVVAGMASYEDEDILGIEQLVLRKTSNAPINFTNTEWKLFKIEGKPCYEMLVCPFGENQILIYGGYRGEWCSDGFIWNGKTRTVDSNITDGGVKLQSFNMGHAMSDHTFVSLVKVEDKTPKLVQFDKRTKKVTIL